MEGNSNKPHPYTVGQCYAVRTVTMIFVGKLEEVFESELVLSTCAWIADTGRFYNFLAEGTASEVEPMPGKVFVGRGSIVDVAEWTHKLFTEQK